MHVTGKQTGVVCMCVRMRMCMSMGLGIGMGMGMAKNMHRRMHLDLLAAEANMPSNGEQA